MVDGKENLSMDFRQRIISNKPNISHQWDVDSLGDIDSLEQFVVSLLFVEIVVNCIFVEHALLDEHQRLDVLQIYVLLQCPRKEEEVLKDARPLCVIFLHRIIGFFNVVRKLFVSGFGDFKDVLICEHVELFPHVLQSHINFKQISFPANQNSLELVDQIFALFEDRAKHLER